MENIEKLIVKCNDKEFRKRVHPNVAFHLTVEAWMIEVVIAALKLLHEEQKGIKKNGK